MRLRSLAAPGLLIALLAATLHSPAGSAAPPARATKSRVFVDGKPDTGQFLPDTFVVCRVGARTTRVADFVRSYFDSYAEYRPAADSAGRVQFLENIIHKDLLGQLALQINRPVDFEDRVVLREHEERVLSNALYRSAVLDSLQVTDADIAHEYETFRYEVRLRHILFADRPAAERVRRDLVSGRIGWKEAYERYSRSRGKDGGPDGDMGWKPRAGATLEMGRKIFTLGPGGISEPVEDVNGWNLVQVVERRDGTPPSLDAMSHVLHDQLAEERTGRLTDAVRSLIRRQVGMTYDTTRIAWAASHFKPTQSMGMEGSVTAVTIDPSMPEFAPEDTSIVLGRYRDGVFTLGRFLHLYTDIQPLVRPSVDTPEAFRNQLDLFAFEPYMAQIARERGLGKDSMVVAQLNQKREQVLVEHLYADSIQSRVVVDPKARRKYYQDHMSGFVTWARVRFAALWAENRAAADSLQARLKAGEKAEDIIRADSLLGIERGSIQERAENEHGPYQKLVFEMLRPGMTSLDGPDKVGHYSVIQDLEFIPGRQLSYDEAAGMIDESLQNLESERLLKALIARHRKEYRIESHPELLMRIRLVDPTL